MQALTNLDLEMAFAKEIVKQVPEWYNLCSSHVMHNHNRRNEFPAVRFDFRDILWGLDLPDMDNEKAANLESKLYERFWEDWRDTDYPKELEREFGFEPFFDMNGYRILCNVRISETTEDIENKEEDLLAEEGCSEPDPEIIESLRDEIHDLQASYIEQAKAIGNFLSWSEKFIKDTERYWKEDMVLVIDDDGFYDYVDGSWYWDMKDENGWRKVTKDGIIDERTHGNKTLEEFASNETARTA